MASMIRKSFDDPEETRPVRDGMGRLNSSMPIPVDTGAAGRATFLPGWKWLQHVKPIAQTDSCMAARVGYTVSGRLKVVMDDGEEMEFRPGVFGVIPPGHDAWVVGDEPYVFIDWQGMGDYAKRSQ